MSSTRGKEPPHDAPARQPVPPPSIIPYSYPAPAPQSSVHAPNLCSSSRRKMQPLLLAYFARFPLPLRMGTMLSLGTRLVHKSARRKKGKYATFTREKRHGRLPTMHKASRPCPTFLGVCQKGQKKTQERSHRSCPVRPVEICKSQCSMCTGSFPM